MAYKKDIAKKKNQNKNRGNTKEARDGVLTKKELSRIARSNGIM